MTTLMYCYQQIFYFTESSARRAGRDGLASEVSYKLSAHLIIPPTTNHSSPYTHRTNTNIPPPGRAGGKDKKNN